MKKLLIAVAIAVAFPVFAQDSTSSGTASSNSSSAPVINTSSGNQSSNVNASGSASANPNNAQNITFNQTGGGASTMDATSRSTSDATIRNINEGTSTQRLEGGTNSTVRNIQEGVSTQNVNYSGTQTVKNVPSIQMSGPASGPCTGVSGGVGVSGPGWGVGFNGSAVMDDCRLRENTRVLGMAMQSLDGNANPQEKGEATVIFMDAVRALGDYNRTIYARTNKDSK